MDAVTLMHDYARQGDVERINQYLINHTSPDALDSDSNTPLMEAAVWGHTQVVAALIRFHANIDAQNKYGDTVLDRATRSSHSAPNKKEQVIAMLRQHKVKANFSLLSYFAMQCDLSGIFYCLMNHVNINLKDYQEKTILFQLADSNLPESKKEAMIKLLLCWGANIAEEASIRQTLSQLDTPLREHIAHYNIQLMENVRLFAQDPHLENNLASAILSFRVWAKIFQTIYRWILKGKIPLDDNQALKTEALPKEKQCYARFLPLIKFYREKINQLQAGEYNRGEKNNNVRLPFDIMPSIIAHILKEKFIEVTRQYGFKFSDALEITDFFFLRLNQNWKVLMYIGFEKREDQRSRLAPYR